MQYRIFQTRMNVSVMEKPMSIFQIGGIISTMLLQNRHSLRKGLCTDIQLLEGILRIYIEQIS